MHWSYSLAPGGCFTYIVWALKNYLAKIYNARNHIYGENFKLKLCTCAQNMALGTGTKFQLEILIRSMIFTIHKFREYILELVAERWWNTPTPPQTQAIHVIHFILTCTDAVHLQPTIVDGHKLCYQLFCWDVSCGLIEKLALVALLDMELHHDEDTAAGNRVMVLTLFDLVIHQYILSNL